MVRHQVPWVDCWLGWRRRRFMRRWRWGGGRGRVFQQGRKRGAACSWVRVCPVAPTASMASTVEREEGDTTRLPGLGSTSGSPITLE